MTALPYHGTWDAMKARWHGLVDQIALGEDTTITTEQRPEWDACRQPHTTTVVWIVMDDDAGLPVAVTSTVDLGKTIAESDLGGNPDRPHNIAWVEWPDGTYRSTRHGYSIRPYPVKDTE